MNMYCACLMSAMVPLQMAAGLSRLQSSSGAALTPVSEGRPGGSTAVAQQTPSKPPFLTRSGITTWEFDVGQ